MRWLLLLLCAAAAAQELPVKEPTEPFDWEPQLMLQDIPDDPGALAPEVTSATVEQARRKLDAARRKKTRWEQLARNGVLSRAEAEGCAVEVSQCLARYERARASEAQQQHAALQLRAPAADAAMIEAAAASAQTTRELASAADKALLQTRLEWARVTLERQRRLFAAGVTSANQVRRAEVNLRKLETPDP